RFVVEAEAVERDLGRETRRAGGHPQPLAACGPAIAEVGILVDVGLIQVDEKVLVTLGRGQHALQLLDKHLPPHRVGPAEQLLGLLPAQIETVQSRPDRLAAADPTEPLTYPGDQALERPAGGRLRARYKARGRGAARGE